MAAREAATEPRVRSRISARRGSDPPNMAVSRFLRDISDPPRAGASVSAAAPPRAGRIIAARPRPVTSDRIARRRLSISPSAATPSERKGRRTEMPGNGSERTDPLARIRAQMLPFASLLGIEFVAASPDRIVAEMVVREDLCTRPAVLHGGAIMAFGDTLGAVGTVLNLPEGAATTTIESKTNFVAP